MPEPFRIAYLTSEYARASDSFIRGEVRQLRRMGCEVHTFSIRRPPHTQDVSDEIRRERAQTDDLLEHSLVTLLGATCLMFVIRPIAFWRSLRLAIRCSPAGIKGRVWALAYTVEAAYVARRLIRLRVDHLHDHIGEGCATVAMLASELSGVPFSVTVHGPNEFDQPTLIALDEKVARSAFVVAISSFGRSQLYRWCRFKDWPKVQIIHCGVDEQFLEAPRTPIPDEPRFVCVGRLAEQKGQLLLVQAIAQLAEAGYRAHLRLAGDGPMRPELERLIAARGLQDQVKILGWCGAEEVVAEILAARALALPSFAEGLPVVFMEALALGRPVVTTAIAGHPELVEHGVVGWLTPASDLQALVAAMREVIDAPREQLERMAAEGAARVGRDHNAETEARRLLALFQASARGEPMTTNLLPPPESRTTTEEAFEAVGREEVRKPIPAVDA